MPASTLTRPADGVPPAATGARQVLVVRVTPSPDVLMRVLSTLRRRSCRVTDVEYIAPSRHHPGQLVVGLVPPRAHGHCVARWVEGLVDVIAVDEVR